MIRVLNIVDTINSGGVERRRLSMAKLLDKTGNREVAKGED